MSRNVSLLILVNLGLHNGIRFVLILMSKEQFVSGIYCKRVVQEFLISWVCEIHSLKLNAKMMYYHQSFMDFCWRPKTCLSTPPGNSLLTVPMRQCCCGSLLPVFGVRVLVTFHLIMYVHFIFSSVSVAEWPLFGK